jgi:hypothetical protein
MSPERQQKLTERLMVIERANELLAEVQKKSAAFCPDPDESLALNDPSEDSQVRAEIEGRQYFALMMDAWISSYSLEQLIAMKGDLEQLVQQASHLTLNITTKMTQKAKEKFEDLRW